MDSDDLSDPRRFLAQWTTLVHRPDIDLLASWQADFESDPAKTFQLKTLPERHEDIVRALRWRNVVPHPSIVFKRDVVCRLGGYRPIRYLEDYDLFMRLVRAGRRLHALQEALIHVRVTPSQRARRGGWQYAMRDAAFRWSLYCSGDISLMNCATSVVGYTAFRLAPPALKGLLYKIARNRPTGLLRER